MTGRMFAALVALAFVTGWLLGHATVFYGMPWQGDQNPTSGVAVFSGYTDSRGDSYCAGVELKGSVGPFWYLPVVGGDTQVCG